MAALRFFSKKEKEENQAGSEISEPIKDEATAEEEDSSYVTGVRLNLIFLGIGLCVLIVALDVSIIGTAVPSITNRFHSTTDIGWYGAAYNLAICSLQPIIGKVYAVFTVKWTFMISIFIFLLGSLLCATAVSSDMFIVGRTVSGIGGAGLTSGALVILRLIAPPKKAALYMGLVFGLFGIAAVSGPLIGGALTEHASWRWCFYINAPIIGVTIAILLPFFHPPEQKDKGLTFVAKLKQLDLVGCGLFVPSIIMLLFALQWGGHQHAWRSATIIGLFCGSGVLFIVFMVWEHFQGEEAMIPPSLVKDRTIILSCLYTFFMMGIMVTNAYYLPEWFQAIKNASPGHSGVMSLGTLVSQTVFSIISGIIISRTGWYNPWFFIGSTAVCISSGLFTTLTPDTPAHKWIGYQVLLGLGTGTAFQQGIHSIQTHLAPLGQSTVSVGMGLLLFFQYLGSASFLSIALTILQNALIRNLRKDASLDNAQIEELLLAGVTNAQKVARGWGTGKAESVRKSYNDAITSIYYIGVAISALAFFLAFGIKWNKIKSKAAVPAAAAASDVEAQSAQKEVHEEVEPIEKGADHIRVNSKT